MYRFEICWPRSAKVNRFRFCGGGKPKSTDLESVLAFPQSVFVEKMRSGGYRFQICYPQAGGDKSEICWKIWTDPQKHRIQKCTPLEMHFANLYFVNILILYLQDWEVNKTQNCKVHGSLAPTLWSRVSEPRRTPRCPIAPRRT